MFLTAQLAGRLTHTVDLRILMMTGFVGFSYGTWLASSITVQWDFYELLVPQILRGASLMLCMVPINNLSLGTLPPDQLKNASGLYNLSRNLGGAVGLAIINTLLNQRTDLHLMRLRESVSWGKPLAEETLSDMTARLGELVPDPGLVALKQLSLMARQQALVMSFADIFFAMSFLFGSLALLAPLMRKPAVRPPAGH